MPELLHAQPGETPDLKEARTILNPERIIRRMVLEAMVPLRIWAQKQDPMTQMLVEGTAKNKNLYEEGTGWERLMEKFCGRSLEILVLRTPIRWEETLIKGKNPAIDRMEELGKAKEDILLAVWHQDHGIMAVTYPDTEDLPNGIEPQTKIVVGEKTKNPLAIWAWDKRNFRSERTN